MIDITPVIEIIIALIGVVITSVIIPYIKKKTSNEQFAFLGDVVKTAVYAAEVLLDGSGRGEQKRDYVLNYVKGVCEEKNITYNENEVRQMLEKAWIDLMAESDKQ